MPQLRPMSIDAVPAAILAGGMARRLGAIAAKTPKAMMDIDGRPFIEHQLSLLRRRGLRKIVLCLGHLAEMIEHRLGNGSSLGMEISYSYDGPNLLGAGGAIAQALPLLGEAFWVMYGDSYMDIDYRAVLAHFERSGAEALMTVLRNENQWDRSNVVFENGRLLQYDKARAIPAMRHIDFGVQLLRPIALSTICANKPSDLADVYRDLTAQGRMIGYEVFERFYEIGTPAALEQTRRHLAEVAGHA